MLILRLLTLGTWVLDQVAFESVMWETHLEWISAGI